MAEIIGGVAITIEGDYSGLQSDLDAAQALAANAASKIADALEVSAPDTTPVTEALQQVSDAATTTGQSIATALDVQITPPDVSAVVDSFAALSEAATTSASAIAGAFAGDALPAPDTSAITDSFAAVDAAAQQTAAGVADSFQGIASALAADVAPVDDFYSALSRLTDAGASIDEAFQTLTGDTQTFMEAISSGSLNDFIDNFGKVGPEAEAAVAGLDSVAGAAGDAAGQLSLFDDAAATPLGDSIGQLNLFADGIQIVSEDSKSAATNVFTFGESITGITSEVAPAAAALKTFSDGAQAIVDAQSKATAELDRAQTVLNEIRAAYEDGAASANTLARAEQGVADAFTAANPAIDASKDKIDATSESLQSMNSALGLVGAAISIGAFVRLAEDVGSTYDSFTKASIALTTLTGDAEQAQGIIEKLDQIGRSDGLAMPGLAQAAQNMTNLLPVGTDVVGIISQLADVAAFTGKSLDTLSTAFDRIVTSSTVSAKQLQGLGTNFDQLKETMVDLGFAVGDFADAAKKAFLELSENDKMVVLQTNMERLKGVAQDMADNTFSGAFHKASATFDSDINLIIKDIGNLNGKMPDLSSGVNAVVAAFVTATTYIKASVEDITSNLVALGVQLQGLGKGAADAVKGQFSQAGKDIADAMANANALVKQSQTDWTNTIAAGGKIVSDVMNQIKASAYAVIPPLDGLGAAGKNTADKVGAAFAAAQVSVQKFDDLVNSDAGSSGSLQRAFENASKAINQVAKADLPAAIQAVDDYTNAQLRLGANDSVVMSAFQEESKLINQLAKVDAPAAVAAMQAVTQSFVDSGRSVGIVTAAYDAEEKIIQQIAKTDAPAAKAAQDALNQTLIDGQQPLALLTKGFQDQQKILESIGKTDAVSAAAGLSALAEQEQKVGEPAAIVTNTLMAQQKVLQDMAKTDLQGAIRGMSDLVDEETKLNQPAQVVQATLTAQQKLLQDLGKTDTQAAIAGLDALAQKEIDLKTPTELVTAAFQAEDKIFQDLARSDLQGAINGLDLLAQKESAAGQPIEVVTKTLQDEQKVLQEMARTDLTGAINGFENLIATEQRLNAPASVIRDTMQAEEKAILELAQTALPTAIQALSNFIDKQNAMKQPLADIEKSFSDLQKVIATLAQTDLTGAIAAQQQLVDKMIAMKLPIADIDAGLNGLSKLYSQLAHTDMPGAVAGFQQVIDKMLAMKSPMADVQSQMKSFEDSVTDLGNRGLPGAGAAMAAYLAELQKAPPAYKDIQAQQEIAIAKDQQMLDMMIKAGDAQGYIRDQQAKTLQDEITYAEKVGQDANDQVLALEKIKIANQEAAIASHGYADAAVQGINDILKGFDQMGTAMAGAIVNGTNLGAALVGEFKKIGQSILADVINAALIPLKLALLELIGGLLPGMNIGLGVVGGSLGTVNAAAGNASAGLTALAQAAQQAAASIVASVNSEAGGGLGIGDAVSEISAVVSAGAAVASAILLAHISSDTGHIEVNTRSCLAELENARADAWSQYNHMYDRIGELLNAVQGVERTLSNLTVTATAAALTPAESSALEATGAAAPVMVGDLNIIAANTAYTFAKLVDIWGVLDVAFGGNSIYDMLAVINASILTVVSAINYGTQSGKSYSDQAAEQDAKVASALAAVGSDVQAGTQNAHAQLSQVDASIKTLDTNGRANSQLTTAQIIDKLNQGIAAAAAGAAGAWSTAAEITSLKEEYDRDIQAMNLALQQGNVALATQYQTAAKNVEAQLIPLLSATHAVNSSVNTVDTSIRNGSTNVAMSATNAGVLVSTAVGQSAATISQAVINSAAASASLFNTGLSQLISITGAFGKAGGGLPGGQSGLPSGSGGGNTNPNGTPTYSNPGIPVGQQPGFNPNPPASGGMTQAQWIATGHNSLAPDWWLNGTPQPGINQANLPHFQTGGAVEATGVAIVDAGEVVLPKETVIAIKSGNPDDGLTAVNASPFFKPTRVMGGDYSDPGFVDHGASKDDNAWQGLADQVKAVAAAIAAQTAARVGPRVEVTDVNNKPSVEVTSVIHDIAASTKTAAVATTALANGPANKTPAQDPGGAAVQIISISASALAAMQASYGAAATQQQSGPSQQDLLAASMNWLNSQQGLSAGDIASATSTYQNDAKAGLLPSPKSSGAGFSGYNPYSTPSFDVGGLVSADMLAMVHAGEWVIPANGKVMLPPEVMARIQMPTIPGAPNVPNVPFSANGGGNDTYNIVINTPSTNPSELVRMVASEIKTRTGRTAKFSN